MPGSKRFNSEVATGTSSVPSVVNLKQLNGTTVDTNSGNKSAGTLRVVIATDQPALTNKLLVTPDANSAVNVAQVGGNAVTAGAGAVAAGTPRVVLATDTTVPNVTGNVAHAAADSGNPVKVGGKYNASGVTLTDGQRGDLQLGPTGHLRVSNPLTFVDVSMGPDTAIMAAGDLIADTTVVTGALSVADGVAELVSMHVFDGDDQGAAFDVFFLSANNSLGTENAAPSISDTPATAVLGSVTVGTADYKDLGANRHATIRDIGLIVKAASGSKDIYAAIVNGAGTPTYASGNLRLRLGFRQM